MDLKELYRDVILDHNRQPRNFGPLEGANHHAEGNNPLCGDRLSLAVRLNGERIEDIRFEGRGCAISTASASLMTEAVKGKDRASARQLFDKVHALLTQLDGAPGPLAGQARRPFRRARVPGARQMRKPLLAHPHRRARLRDRGHGVHRVAPCADTRTSRSS